MVLVERRWALSHPTWVLESIVTSPLGLEVVLQSFNAFPAPSILRMFSSGTFILIVFWLWRWCKISKDAWKLSRVECKGLIILVYFALPISLHHCCCASFLLVQWRYSLLLDVDMQLKFYLLVTERCDIRGSFSVKSLFWNTLKFVILLVYSTVLYFCIIWTFIYWL